MWRGKITAFGCGRTAAAGVTVLVIRLGSCKRVIYIVYGDNTPALRFFGKWQQNGEFAAANKTYRH